MADSQRVPLSAGEMEIMEIIWERGEVAAQEVRDLLAKRRDISRTTVRTMLSRMERKGWLKHRVISQTFFYSPLVARETSLGQRVLEMVDRGCGGQPERLVNALIEYRGLSSEEVGRIRAMLDAADTERKPRRRKRR